MIDKVLLPNDGHPTKFECLVEVFLVEENKARAHGGEKYKQVSKLPASKTFSLSVVHGLPSKLVLDKPFSFDQLQNGQELPQLTFVIKDKWGNRCLPGGSVWRLLFDPNGPLKSPLSVNVRNTGLCIVKGVTVAMNNTGSSFSGTEHVQTVYLECCDDADAEDDLEVTIQHIRGLGSDPVKLELNCFIAPSNQPTYLEVSIFEYF